MRRLYFLLICALFSSAALAQQKTQTLFSNENDYGGFGGPIIVFSNINGTMVGDVGGGGAWSINSFFIGGYGLGNDGAQVDVDDQTYDIHFRHGGFWLGYGFQQHKVVHIYSSFRIGWGSTKLKQNEEKFYDDNLLALSPEIGIEMNFTNWFKLGITGGYRVVSGIDSLPVLTNDDFTGTYAALTFRFGGFGDYHSYEKDSFDSEFD